MTETFKTRLIVVLISIGILFSTFLCYHILKLSPKLQQIKTDLAELNHARYGILNIDEWKKSISVILADKIKAFDITEGNRKNLKRSIGRILYKFINKIDRTIRKKNKKSLGGKIKQFFTNIFINFKKLKKQVPEFSEIVIKELEHPRTKKHMERYLLTQLNKLSEETYNRNESAPLKRLLHHYRHITLSALRTELAHDHLIKDQVLVNLSILLVIMSGLTFYSILSLPKRMINFKVAILIISALGLLAGGIFTPMIDIEAKIENMDMQLLGEQIRFDNQILFFQSKSIIDVVGILVKNGKLLMFLVGVLIFSFSVLFPMSKMVLTLLYQRISSQRFRSHRVVDFFVFKSGKWSMADVMVVTMFMAFIAFDGIVSSQLAQLGQDYEHIEILTTNGTQLGPGFLMFLAFTIFSLLISEFLTKKTT